MKKFLTSLSFLALFATGFTAKAEVNEFQKILASDGEADDQFGFSISVSGDTAIVGAPYDDELATNAGAVYVFNKDEDGNWEEAQKLTASEAITSYGFGYSVSIDGDVLAVSSISLDEYVWIFERDEDGNWNEVQKITSDSDASFGTSIVLQGQTLVVGAPKYDSNKGTVYIFSQGEDGEWTESAQLLPSDPTKEVRFGSRVAISDETIVIGTSAHGAFPFWDPVGAAYVFSQDEDGNWEEEAILTSDGVSADFSTVVSIYKNTIVIEESGYIYIFESEESGVWEETSVIEAGPPDYHCGVEIMDEDTLIVADREHVMIFQKDDEGNWAQTSELNPSSTSDAFGWDVAVSDGVVMTSAYGDDDAAENSGSVYIFTPEDEDGDEYLNFSLDENEVDCDDADPFINPSPAFEDREIYDGVDNNCDGRIDEGTEAFDDDGDGYTEDGGDCDDSNSLVSPSATETVGDLVDNDCDGSIDERFFLKAGTRPKLIKKI